MAIQLTAWDVTEKVLPHSSRILLYGPPGTGKTSLAYADGSEPEVVQCHEETSVAEVIGHFVPVGDRFVWLDGPALSAWRFGKRLLIDEIDLASGPVLSMMRGICNDPSVARIRIPDPALSALSAPDLATAIATGKALQTLKPHPGFQVIATMNGVPEDLDEPLADRFPVKQFIPFPHPDAIKSLPEDLRAYARKSTKEKDDNRRIGVRAWKAFAELREKVGHDMAAKAVFDSRAGDILDAIRLATPAKAKEVEPEDKPSGYPEDAVIAAVKAKKPFEESESDAYITEGEHVVTLSDAEVRPRAYSLRTGRRGRPPRAVCAIHGPLSHRTGEIAEGNLCCRPCRAAGIPASIIAKSGGFSYVEKVGADPISGKGIWETHHC